MVRKDIRYFVRLKSNVHIPDLGVTFFGSLQTAPSGEPPRMVTRRLGRVKVPRTLTHHGIHHLHVGTGADIFSHLSMQVTRFKREGHPRHALLNAPRRHRAQLFRRVIGRAKRTNGGRPGATLITVKRTHNVLVSRRLLVRGNGDHRFLSEHELHLIGHGRCTLT